VKALVSLAPGGPETLVLQDMPDPVASDGEIVIDVRACGVNFLDTLIVRDEYQIRPERPFAPGVEVAGVVCAIGSGASRFAVGDRVIAMLPYGGMVEKVAIAEERVFALPDAMSFEQGAGLLLTYGTSIHALRDRGRMKPGETMLVLGAGGGAGLSAVELGTALGLRVIGAVSSEEKAAAVRNAGAQDVVLYGRPPFDRDAARALSKQFKAACGGEGPDIVYDAVGGDYAEPALRSMAWYGRYIVIGFAAGIPKLPFNLPLLKALDICGVFYGAFVDRDPAHNHALCQELLDLAAAGKIAPHVHDVLPHERGGEAISLLGERRAVGKVVVRIGD
jgi:NADPH:quinone reductase-like Zn-dependent oxidoreductase